ncbi:MAG: DegT/DnrJ/EryC1/StrS family aminotransferase [Polyangiales bacterium]
MNEPIPVSEPDLSGNELEYVSRCIRSGWVSSVGEYVTQFEAGFAKYCNAEHCVATANGTVAIHLALVSLGIQPGDEVIVPSLTFVATANAVVYAQAKPVFVDSDPTTWTMSVREIAPKITPRTKAIIVVHLYGHPVDMAPILELAKQHGLWVIEDAAEAHGAEYHGQRVGGLGDAGVFSFYGNKIITTGEGGALVTNDAALRQRAGFLRDHAMSPERRYYHSEIGYNYRLTNLQAAVGLAQLERIETFLAAKRSLARAYAERLGDVPGIVLAPEAPWAKSSYWMYSVLIQDAFPLRRDALIAHLKARGIDTRPFFEPLHTLPPYAAGATPESLPVAERLAREGLNLPSSTKLTTAQVDRVVEAIRAAL